MLVFSRCAGYIISAENQKHNLYAVAHFRIVLLLLRPSLAHCFDTKRRRTSYSINIMCGVCLYTQRPRLSTRWVYRVITINSENRREEWTSEQKKNHRITEKMCLCRETWKQSNGKKRYQRQSWIMSTSSAHWQKCENFELNISETKIAHGFGPNGNSTCMFASNWINMRAKNVMTSDHNAQLSFYLKCEREQSREKRTPNRPI